MSTDDGPTLLERELPTLGLAGVVALKQIGLGLLAGRPDDPEYYRSLHQAPFAPPAWAFGPAWTIAKAGQSYALARTLLGRGEQKKPKRETATLIGLLAADADAVVDVYITFSHVYFRRRSPVLAAVWTVADAAITAAIDVRPAHRDRVAAAAMLPQTAWPTLAAPVAVWHATSNPDPFLGTPALVSHVADGEGE